MTPPVYNPTSSTCYPRVTSVHTEQTTGTELLEPSFRAYSLKPVMTEYIHAERALTLSDSAKHAAQLKRMRACRESAWFVQHEETFEVRVASQHCNVRWCPMCAATRRAAITPGIAAWIRKLHRPKFLTLTLRHCDLDLKTQVNQLYDAFRRLRRLKWFRGLCRGGIWFFQVKRSRNSRQWHPHLHILLDAEWIEHAELVRHWKYLTRGSTVVDIRKIKDDEGAAVEVARYATTPAALVAHSDGDKVEILECFDRRRIAGTWGTAQGVPLRPVKQDDWYKWRHVGNYWYIVQHRALEPAFESIIKAWQTGHPAPVKLFIDPPPDEPDLHTDQVTSDPQRWLDFYANAPPIPLEAL